MIEITLKPINHRQRECIAIFFKRDRLIEELIKKIEGIKWSRTHNCWWLPFNKKNYDLLKQSCSNKVFLNISAIRKYLLDKNKIAGKDSHDTQIYRSEIKGIGNFGKRSQETKIHEPNLSVVKEMKQNLILKAYSPSTIKTYLNEFSAFLQAIKHRPAQDFTIERIKDYQRSQLFPV